MKHKHSKLLVSLILCVAMLMSVVPMTGFAAIANWANTNVTYDSATFGTNGYYNVISKKDYTLIPGAATETEMVLNNSAGNRRQVMHIIELDPSNPAVSVLPGYYGIDTDWATNTANQKAAGVTSVAQYYRDNLGYNVVGAMNTALAYDTNAPYSFLVYNGEVLVDAKNNINNFHSGSCQTMLCVYKDAVTGECSVELRTSAQGLRGDEWQAIGANFAMVVRDGALVTTKEERTSDAAARSMVGVKADGTLVLVMNDGRGANNSKGFNNYELGESMLALGCKWAFNCDGGGSSSFVTKRAGEDELTLRCVPCDGAERPTLNSVIIASNVGATGVLDTISIDADYDFFAPGTAYTFGARALDTHGFAMDMPANAVWQLSDESFGSIENGTFASNGKTGEVKIQIKVNDTVVGEREITVANPTVLNFKQASTVLPYGKNTTLEFTSLIGEAEVYLDGSSFSFSMSNDAAGTLNGLVFTATNDETVSGAVITAKYLATNTDLTYNIEFGKGSEIIWDFEDGDLHGFLGQQDAYDWQKARGIENPFGFSDDGLNTLINKGQISTDVSSTAFISTVENGGKVHNGKKALGFTFDMTQNNFNNWTYCVMFNISNVDGDVVFRDVANGKKATTFGAWVYVPYGFYTAENSGALALQANLFGSKTTKENAAQIGLNMQYNGKNLNALKESDIPENRWVYAVADISAYNYVSLVDPLQSNHRSPSIMRMYVKPSVAQKLTYYFDDFTLDYSSAVDDRIPPVISNPQYAPADTNIAFDDEVTITEAAAGFTAYVSDANSGIDASTAQIYVDGNKVTTKVTGNMIFCDAVSLGTGTHKVKFEIADKLGNFTTLTRTIVSNTADAEMASRVRIEISGHNDSNEAPMPGSVYFIDVCKNRSANETSKFTLNLNTANLWILDQMIVADNTTVSYDVNPTYPNEVTFTCKSTKASDSNEVMLSIPVQVYNPLITNGTSDGTAVTVSGKSFKAPLTVELTSCTVNGEYGNYFEYSVSELDSVRKIVRHEHTAQAIDDKPATATEAGYTGRTYCDVCQSVVDWGETIPAKGHHYELVNGQFVCTDDGCDEVYTPGTGLFEMNGNTYYAIAGNLISGWQEIESDWYYFDPVTFTGVDTLNNGYVTYEFEPNARLISGKWYVTDAGRRYYYGPTYWTGKESADFLVEIDGKKYYFNKYGYCMTGHKFITLSQSDYYQWYDFGEDGAMIGTWDYTGFAEQFGYKYYLENGITQYGMHLVDGAYYYSPSANHFAVSTNLERYCPATNDLLPKGTYRFGADGKMLDKTVCNVDGTLCYYEMGKIVTNTSFRYNDIDYPVDGNGKVIFTGTITDAYGMTGEYVDGIKNIKNGIVEEDGDLYYYENDVKVAKGLVKVGEDYYYFANSFKALKNGTYTLYANKLYDLLPDGSYTFDADGKIVLAKDGLAEEGGKLYYYENGEKVKKGMVKIGEDYYYFGINYYAFTDGTYYLYANPEKMIDGFGAGYYTFGADGKMVLAKDGLAEEDGKLYYYENGEKVKKGMVKIGEDYYYFGINYYAFTDGTYYLYANPEKMIDGFGAGNYTFGADGKMIIPE